MLLRLTYGGAACLRTVMRDNSYITSICCGFVVQSIFRSIIAEFRVFSRSYCYTEWSAISSILSSVPLSVCLSGLSCSLFLEGKFL